MPPASHAAVLALGLGVVALCEVLRSRVLPDGDRPRRVAWATASCALAGSLCLAAGEGGWLLLSAHAAVSVGCVLVVRIACRRSRLGVLEADFGAALGLLPWWAARQSGAEPAESILAYVILLMGLGAACMLMWWPLRSAWFLRRTRGRSWWPVRPETVGPKMWPIVQPRAVAIAVMLQFFAVVWVLLPSPWPLWVYPALSALAFLAMLYTLYRTEVRGYREGWVRHHPRDTDRSSTWDPMERGRSS